MGYWEWEVGRLRRAVLGFLFSGEREQGFRSKGLWGRTPNVVILSASSEHLLIYFSCIMCLQSQVGWFKSSFAGLST